MRFLTLVLLFSGGALAEENNSRARLGVGVLLGEPTGFSAELEFDRTHSLDAALSYSLVEGELHVHSDYLLKLNDLGTKHKYGRFVPYFGLGAQLALGSRNDGGLSVRFPVGMINLFSKHPLGLFFELVPGMAIVPETRLVMGAGLGIRFYF